MQKIAIIIPCYNEENRINETPIIALLENTSADIYLANDGSSDRTLAVLEKIASVNPQRCFVLHYAENSGKAHTVFLSVNRLLAENRYDYIGYFDADFSTPPSEIVRMTTFLQPADDFFIMGSRVKLLNTQINRKTYRHIIGRVIVTIINVKHKLEIYDTQCGAKFFSASVAKKAFDKPFVTSWLFDVEIFIRLKKLGLLPFGREIPLLEWKDVDGSKLGFQTAFKIFRELYLLGKAN